MAQKYDQYEASAKLDLIAEKLKEIDRLLQAAYPHFDQRVMDLIDNADPNHDMDPDHWANKIRKVAETILNDRVDEDEAPYSVKETSLLPDFKNEGPPI